MGSKWQDLRQAISGKVLDRGLASLSRLASLHPRARPGRYGVEVSRDIDFGGERLDVYRPREAAGDAIPILYLHGGGFRILSKDTHWAMALAFAARRRADGRRYVVFVPNYRLAPRHPFPAALEDAARALLWVADNAARYGADPESLVVAGESAGANLSVALGIARAWSRPEPYARAVYEAAPPMRALLPACGIFQVSDPLHRGTRDGWVLDRVRAVSEGYLPKGASPDGRTDLADVLPFLERGPTPTRALPPLFAVAGGRDPVLADSERLTPAWLKHGGEATHTVYPDGFHTFHAFLWTPLARRAWRDQHAFLERVIRS